MLYRFLWFFFIYAFLGWCTEVSYAALVTGKFVNRGFLNGPWCPVYGFGVVIVLGALTPLSENLPILFVGSMILTSILEYLTGFVLEKLFRQRWWDYSDQPFNFSGYICLRFSIAWGLACVFVVRLLHPTVQKLIQMIPRLLSLILLGALVTVMAIDLAATVASVIKLNRRLAHIDELAAKIKAASDEFGENLADKVLDTVERRDNWKAEMDERHAQARLQLAEWRASMQELLEREPFGQRRLLMAFPRLRSIHHNSALEHLHRHMGYFKER